MKFSAVIFDMDGTLTEATSSWVYLHQHFGTDTAARANLARYEKGEISYLEFMRLDISLWPLPIHIAEIEGILGEVKLCKGAPELVQYLSPRVDCLLLSAGIDILANGVTKRLGMKDWIANGLETDDSGYLTGKGIERVPLRAKLPPADSMLKALGFDWSQCIAVGDSRFDADLLQNAGLSIAVGTDERLREMAMLRVPDLWKLLEVISKLQFD